MACLYPHATAKALADATDMMLTGDTLERMSENILQDYSQGERTWNAIAQGVINIYKKVTKP